MEGEICSQCCGREREETIDCPIDCGFLIESRIHDKDRPIDPSLYPDLRPTEAFVHANQNLFVVISLALFSAGLETQACIDRDLEEALDAAIRNRKSRESGLIYDGKPDNRIAAGILERLESRLREFRDESAQWEGYKPPSDSDLLKMLVFVRILASSHDNGRRKSRAFLHFLYGIAAQRFPEGIQEDGPSAAAPTLIS